MVVMRLMVDVVEMSTPAKDGVTQEMGVADEDMDSCWNASLKSFFV